MFPSASSAGLVTGCRLSAMGTATFRVWGLLRWPFVATTTGPDVAPSGTRATRKPSELITTVPSTSPNCTRGRRKSGGPQPRPGNTSPPPRQRQSRRHRLDVRTSIHVLFTQDTVGKSHDTQLSRRKAVLDETFTQISSFEWRVSQL